MSRIQLEWVAGGNPKWGANRTAPRRLSSLLLVGVGFRELLQRDAECLTLFGADGLTARGSHLYVAVNARNRITRVSPSRQLTTVVEGGALSFPSEVVFDPTATERAFIRNLSPESPDAAGVLRTQL